MRKIKYNNLTILLLLIAIVAIPFYLCQYIKPNNNVYADSNFIEIGEIWDNNLKTFNNSNIGQLYSVLSSDGNFSSVETNANTIYSSGDIRLLNSKNVKVTLLDKKWNIVYLSKDINGNVILTLYLDCEDITTYWGDNNINVLYHNNFTINDNAYSSLSYSTSYIRATMLNNGGLYIKDKDDKLDVEVAIKDNESQYNEFTIDETSYFSDFIVKPKDVSWQISQSAKTILGLDSDLYNEDVTSANLISQTYKYNAWLNDNLWLASYSEVGSATIDGLWGLDNYQRANDSSYYRSTYLRSANAGGVFQLSYAGDSVVQDNSTDNIMSVGRPCMHLNLSAINAKLDGAKNVRDDNFTINLIEENYTYSGNLQNIEFELKENSSVILPSNYYVEYLYDDSFSQEMFNAGNYYVYLIATNENYIGRKCFIIEMQKATLNVTAESYSIIYGDDKPDIDIDIAGLVSSEDESDLDGSLNITCDYEKGKNVGNYSIVLSGYSSLNYDINYTNGNIEVNQLELDFTWGSNKLTYNAQNQKPTIIINNIVGDDDVDFIYDNDGGFNVGNYTISIINVTNSNYKLPNSNLSINYDIDKAPLLIKAEDVTILYNGTPPVFIDVEYEGMFDIDKIYSAIFGNTTLKIDYGEYKLVDGKYPGVGDYPITLYGLSTTNYEISYSNIILHVVPQQLEIVWMIDDLTYNGLEQIPGYFLNNIIGYDDVDVLLSDGGINAGFHDINIIGLKGLDSSNYDIELSSHRYEIKKATLTFISVDHEITYGDDISYNGRIVDGFKNEEEESVLTGELIYSTNYIKGQPAGEYYIFLSGFSSSNYKIDYYAGILNVLKKEINITWESNSAVYNGEMAVPKATAIGALFDDEIIVNVEGNGINVGSGYIARAVSLSNESYKLPNDNIEIEYSITPLDISSSLIDICLKKVIYNAQVHEATAWLQLKGIDLIEGVDYIVSTSIADLKRVNVGYVNISVEGKGNFMGNRLNFQGMQIIPFDVNEENTEIFGISDTIYNGQEKTFNQIYLKAKTIEEIIPKDSYTIEYKNNVNAGLARVIIRFKNNFNYSGEGIFTFNIEPYLVNKYNSTISINNTNYIYTGNEIKPLIESVKVTLDNQDILLLKEEYNVEYFNNIYALEDAYIRVNFVGNYKGFVDVNFNISKAQINEDNLRLEILDGEDIYHPDVIIYWNDEVIDKDLFDIEYIYDEVLDMLTILVNAKETSSLEGGISKIIPLSNENNTNVTDVKNDKNLVLILGISIPCGVILLVAITAIIIIILKNNKKQKLDQK